MAKVGRPSEYTQEAADKFCELIATGSSLRSACLNGDMPAPITIFSWFRKYPEFAAQYARATSERAEAMAEEIMDIADDGSNDWMVVNGKDGSESWQLKGEHIQRSRLRVDTRKWLMSKMVPKKYGEHLDVKQESEVTHKFENLTDEQLDHIIQERQARISESA